MYYVIICHKDIVYKLNMLCVKYYKHCILYSVYCTLCSVPICFAAPVYCHPCCCHCLPPLWTVFCLPPGDKRD